MTPVNSTDIVPYISFLYQFESIPPGQVTRDKTSFCSRIKTHPLSMVNAEKPDNIRNKTRSKEENLLNMVIKYISEPAKKTRASAFKLQECIQ
jgi:hypothetical protein